MIEFGQTLKTARENCGYTIQQLADITRVSPANITALETEDFSRINAPIYGRGFVKLYCNAVHLDPKPMIDEFMEIYNGNRQSTIRQRATATTETEATAPVEQAAPEAAPAVTIEPTVTNDEAQPQPEQEPSLFAFNKPTINEPADEVSLPDQHTERSSFSQYSAPFREYDSKSILPSFNNNLWRMVFLVIVAVALIIAIILGIRSLYRLTNNNRKAPDTPMVQVPQNTPTQSNPSAKERTPMKIPDLYVD